MCPLHATKSAVQGSGRCAASCAPSTATGMPRAWADSMIDSIDGIHPVMFDAAVIARTFDVGAASRAASTSATVKVPSVSHST